MHHMVGKAAWGMRYGILVVVGALIVGGCSGTASETTTTTVTTTTSTTSTTSTTAAPPTTTTTTLAPTTTVDPLARPDVLVSNVDRNSIDDFDTSGDNVYLVAMELQDLFVYLEGSPTDDADQMASLLFERDFVYWNPIMIGFLELTDHPGWHYSDPGVETLAIEVVEYSGSEAVVRIADHRAEQVITGSNNEFVKRYDGWNRRITEFTLRRGLDGLWRYADAQPSESASDENLASMVKVEWTGRDR